MLFERKSYIKNSIWLDYGTTISSPLSWEGTDDDVSWKKSVAETHFVMHLLNFPPTRSRFELATFLAIQDCLLTRLRANPSVFIKLYVLLRNVSPGAVNITGNRGVNLKVAFFVKVQLILEDSGTDNIIGSDCNRSATDTMYTSDSVLFASKKCLLPIL